VKQTDRELPFKGLSIMTEASINKTTTAKPTASPFGMPDYGIPKFEIPKFDLPSMEMPEAFRQMAEQGAAHARDAYAKAKVANDEAADMLQNSYAIVAKGVTDYNLKFFEIARTNTRAAFDFAHELLGAKSPSEFIELSTAHTRKQFEAMAAQTKEVTEFVQKVTTEITAKDWRHGGIKPTR
jgi:phasin